MQSVQQGDDIFLKGAYLEVGINKRGYYGTHVAAPDSFVSFALKTHDIANTYATQGKGLSIIADHHRDGQRHLLAHRV